MKDAYSTQELTDLLGKARQVIERTAKNKDWRYREEPGQGRGGKIKLWLVASMDEQTRIALGKSVRTGLTLIHGSAKPAQDQPLPPSSIPACQTSDPELPPALLQKAALKSDLVQAYLDAKAWGRKHGRPMSSVRADFVTGYNAGAICASLRAALGETSWQSLERWAVELRRSNYDCAAIAPRYGLHRKGHTKVTPAEEERLLALLLSQHQFKIGTAIELTKQDLSRQGLASPSSASTLRNFAEAWRREHADVWTLAREGEKALIDKIAPFLRRDASLLAVGDVLIADGHRLNFRIKHPVHGRPCRASLIAFQDWASRDIAGYTFMLEEDLAAVHLALYRAILRLGKLPRAVLLDNGKAFKARIFTDNLDLTTSGMAGLYGRLGIQCHFARPYNARSKPVESFFKTLGLSFEKAVSSYCGGNIMAKPARMRRNEKFMQEIEPERLLTMDEAAGLFESWLNTFYRVKSHSGLSGKTPGEVFAAGRGPGLDQGQIRFLMMHEEVADLGNNGVRRFKGEYFHEALYGLREQVLIRFDWHDLRQIWVYRLDGEFLCMAKRQQPVHPMFSLAGGKDAPGYSDFKQGLSEQKSLIRGTKKLVRQAAKQGLVAQARDILPIAEMEAASPRLVADLENIEAENTPQPRLPDFDDDIAAKPAGPGPLIDPTRLDYLSTEDLEAEISHFQSKIKGGAR
jgi:putative transposase